MIPERLIREACHREHVAIVRSCARWDLLGHSAPDLMADIAHHSVVLCVLRDYSRRYCQTTYHA